MGDEGHNRNRAGTSLLLRTLLPALLTVEEPTADVVAAAEFISGNDHFFLNLAMAAGKATADAAAGTAGSSIVTAMARNGTEFGVRLAGTGDRWFTGPAGVVDGLYLPGFGPEDANRDIGDSTITETIGIGGMAMAAAPAIVRFVGGSPADAVAATLAMYDITWAESASYQLPALGFRGTPLGIDAREVVHTGVLPTVNTGIAHKDPGVGQVGAGLVEAAHGGVRGRHPGPRRHRLSRARAWSPSPPTWSPPRSWNASRPAPMRAWSSAPGPPPPGSTWTGSSSPSPPARCPSSPTPSPLAAGSGALVGAGAGAGGTARLALGRVRLGSVQVTWDPAAPPGWDPTVPVPSGATRQAVGARGAALLRALRGRRSCRGAVDNHQHTASRSATLPHRGPEHRRARRRTSWFGTWFGSWAGSGWPPRTTRRGRPG